MAQLEDNEYRVDRPELDPSKEIRDRALARMDSLVKEYPGHLLINLLYARLGKTVEIRKDLVFDPTQGPPDPETRFGRYVAALERAIAVKPDDADLHYWKARILMVLVPAFVPGGLEEDLRRGLEEGLREWAPARAVEAAHRALALAPGDPGNRELLAWSLVAVGRPEEACDSLQALDGGDSRLQRALSAWRALGVPPGAIFEADRSLSSARKQRSVLPDFPLARVRVWRVPGTAAAIESFYRGRWPRYRLFQYGEERSELYKTRDLVGQLAADGDSLSPAQKLRGGSAARGDRRHDDRGRSARPIRRVQETPAFLARRILLALDQRLPAVSIPRQSRGL